MFARQECGLRDIGPISAENIDVNIYVNIWILCKQCFFSLSEEEGGEGNDDYVYVI